MDAFKIASPPTFLILYNVSLLVLCSSQSYPSWETNQGSSTFALTVTQNKTDTSVFAILM